MHLKLLKLGLHIHGPLVDPLLKEPWDIGVEKEVEDHVGHQLLIKYPDFYVKVTEKIQEESPLERLKKVEPTKDKLLRNIKDKAIGT